MSTILDRHREALDQNPENGRAFDALQEHLFLEGAWQDLVAVYRRRLEAPSFETDVAARVTLLFRLAQILEERSFEVDEAMQIYWEVARLDPKHRPALRQLRAIHAHREQWDLVLQIAEIESQLEMEPYERGVFLAELGDIWREKLDEAGEALSHYQRALEADPEQQRALAGLAQTQQIFGRPQEAGAAWQRLIDLQRGPERAPALVALGNLYSGPLRNSDRARECFRKALTDDPRSEDAVESLVIIASAEEQWELLADLLERRFDLASGARHRSAIAIEAGTAYLERLKNPAAARKWYERAIEFADEEISVHHAMAELERTEDNTDGLLNSLERIIELADDAAPVSVLLEAADLHSEASNDERARQYLERALERSPDDPIVLETLSDVLTRMGESADLAEVLERRAAVSFDDPESQSETLCELARVYEDDLQDIDAATAVLAKAFDANPQSVQAGRRLERLYRKAERWVDLRMLLERGCRQASSAVRCESACSLGELLCQHFDDHEAAKQSFELALEISPDSIAALQGLERIARDRGDEDEILRVCECQASASDDPVRLAQLIPELVALYEARSAPNEALAWAKQLAAISPDGVAAIRSVARLQQQLGDASALRETLEQLEPLMQGSEQAEIRRQLAQLLLDAGDEDGAIASLEAAVESDGRDIEALQQLKRHFEANHRLQDVVRVQRKLADALSGEEAAACLDELATVLEEQLGDADGAIVVRWRLCGLEARSADAPEKLSSLLERTGRFEELAQHLLERRRAVADDADEGEQLDLRRANLLLDQLGQAEEAASLFRSIRARNPGSAEATEGLEQALRTSNDAAGLVVLLESRARNEGDPATRARIDFDRAILLEDSLGEQEGARSLYEALCDQQDDVEIAEQASLGVDRLLERQGDWAALRIRLENAVGNGAPEDDLPLHERLAALCHDRLADREGSILHLEAVGELQPHDGEAWRRLGSLYHEMDRHDDLLRVMIAELESDPSEERELVLRARVARLCVAIAEREDPPNQDSLCTARTCYERVLEIDAAHTEAMEFLIDHFESEDRPADVVQLLRARLETAAGGTDEAETAGLRTSLRLRIADLLSSRLDDAAGAALTLEQALAEIGPKNVVADPLASLYEERGEQELLFDLCRSASGASEAGGERAIWLDRLGGALARAGQLAEAAQAYCEALADGPADRDIEARLRDIYRQLDEPGPLVALLESEIPRRSAANQLPLRMELAELLTHREDRLEDALTQLQQVLEIDPNSREAFDLAMTLGTRLERHDAILDLIDRRLGSPADAALKAELTEHRADLLAGPLDRPEEAVIAYREALSLDPGRQDSRLSLRLLLERLERWSAVLDCLHMEACAPDCEDPSSVLELAVEIAGQHLSSDATLPWLERLRAERPDDPDLLARVADVHRNAGRPEAVLRALEAQLLMVDDDASRQRLHVDRGEILAGDLLSPSRAITAFEMARTLAPENAEVLAELDRLYDLTGRTRDRVEVIQARIERTAPADRIALHRECAALCSTGLVEPESAIPHLMHAVDLSRAAGEATGSEYVELLRELGENLRTADHAIGWVHAGNAELAVLESDPGLDPTRIAQLHFELAMAYIRELGLPHLAMDHLRSIIDTTTTGAGEPAGHLSAEQLSRSEEELIRRLREERNHVELAQRLEQALRHRAGDGERWLELARLRAEQLHSPGGAADAYRETLSRQPSCLAAMRGLRHVSECLRDWSETARSLELELALEDHWSPRELLALYSRLGDICWHRLEATERAAAAYRAGLAACPGDLDTLRALAKLLEDSEAWEEALDLFESEVEILGDTQDDRRQELWLKVARIAAGKTSDSRRALTAYEQAAELAALEPSDQRAFAELYRSEGDLERYVDAFSCWCDLPGAGATSWNHLTLVGALEELGRGDAALDRARVASREDTQNVAVWDALAALHEDRGELADAREALERAAELHEPRVAAEKLMHASHLCHSDHAAAAELLRRSIQMDPGLARTHAELASVAEQTLELEESEAAAARAIDLTSDETGLDRDLKLATCLIGGRVALRRERLEAAARFFGIALEIDADNCEALDAQGDVLFACGEYTAARKLLEARLELSAESLARPKQTAIIARGLEHEGDVADALARYREALALQPDLMIAHEGIVRIHEQAEHVEMAISALESWIHSDPNPATRASSHLRVAAHQIAEGQLELARDHLDEAVASAPDLELAWALLAELLFDQENMHEAQSIAEQARELVSSPALKARIALVRGRILDAQQERRPAAEAFGEAASNDPRCVEAAVSQARLLRGMGDWYAAAEALAEFSAAHPEPEDLGLAQIHLERGRLMAGPLESVDEAILCYEKALALEPSLKEAREPLASLLAHVPERWQDAVRHHRELLAEDPTRLASLRALLEVSRRRDLTTACDAGLSLLRALGATSPEETSYAPDSLPLRIGAEGRLDDPLLEKARMLCDLNSQEIGAAIGATEAREAEVAAQRGEEHKPNDVRALEALGAESGADTQTQAFWQRVFAAEDRMTAPALCRLSAEDMGSIVYTITALAADLGGNCNDGPFLHDLDQSIGRWMRRKIRKALGDTTLREIQSIAYDEWRDQIRILAACAALDESGGDLRSALIGLCCADSRMERGDDPPASADISSIVAGSDLAGGLLSRVVEAWCRELTASA